MAGGANPQATQQAQQPNMQQPFAQPQQGSSVYNQSAGAYNAALGGTANAMAGPNIGQFMNPYTNMVTGQAMGDLERQRQMATNTMDAQATQAGAFGGSRHGIANAATNEGFARQGANMFGNLQSQGFNTALGAAQNQQNIGLQGAGQMGNLANMGFGFGQQITGQQAQQGGLQQGMQQMLIDASKGQFQGYANSPMQSLAPGQSALGSAQFGQSTTDKRNPGLFDYLTLGATAYAASDIRLKKNITPTHNDGGVQFYNWEWNDEGKRVAADQGTHGVIADELLLSHPDLVIRGPDGYLRVDYKGLEKALA